MLMLVAEILDCATGSKEPFIAGAVLRIGTSRSWPVDSFARGNLCTPIDLGTGRLGRVTGRSETARRSSTKPTLRQAHRSPARRSRVGNTSWPGFLSSARPSTSSTTSAGTSPSRRMGSRSSRATATRTCGCLQIQGPLLANPHVRRFYEAHGVVRAPRACVDAPAGARCS
jgi:hypothetical protein